MSRPPTSKRRRPSLRLRATPPAQDAARRSAAVSARLKVHGLKRSGVRDAVVEEFFRAGTHVSIDDLLARVRQRIPATGFSTVYRTMRLLVDHGFATTRDFGGAHTLFEPADTRHHDHIVCTRCGAVREFEEEGIEALQERVARRLGFVITSHRLELYGQCARCAEGTRGERATRRT